MPPVVAHEHGESEVAAGLAGVGKVDDTGSIRITTSECRVVGRYGAANPVMDFGA